MKAAKQPMPMTGKEYPPKSPEAVAIKLAFCAMLETATSTTSTGIILAEVVEA